MNEDTLHLLGECAAGTDMAIRSLEDILKDSGSGPLQDILRESKSQHEKLAAQAQALLRGAGYRPAHPAACIRHLIGRLRQETDFPHEIGLFLGYPPEDVRGFIQRGACGCKCAGCWKVYGDEAAARAQFARFERCTRDCCARYAAGVPIERLAVAG